VSWQSSPRSNTVVGGVRPRATPCASVPLWGGTAAVMFFGSFDCECGHVPVCNLLCLMPKTLYFLPHNCVPVSSYGCYEHSFSFHLRLSDLTSQGVLISFTRSVPRGRIIPHLTKPRSWGSWASPWHAPLIHFIMRFLRATNFPP
jgi:hypothetical protein